MTQAAALIAVRAQLHAWRGVIHELRWKARSMLARRSSTLLVILGGLGAIGGGFLVGRWLAGLVIIAESAGLIWLGLNQDDGTEPPPRGARTVEDVLEVERWRE